MSLPPATHRALLARLANSMAARFIAFALLAILCAMPRAFADAPAGSLEVEFKLDVRAIDPKPSRVNLAGSFNGWSKDATPMTRDANDLFTVKLSLPEGVTTYKFVLDGDRWMSDPTGEKELEVDDGHGGKNSGILVGPDARKLPPPLPNDIKTDFVTFNPADPQDLNVADNSTLRVRLRTQADDVEQVYLVAKGKQFALNKIGTERGVDVFGGAFNVADQVFTEADVKAFEKQQAQESSSAIKPVAGQLWFNFKLVDGTATKIVYAPARPDRKAGDALPIVVELKPDFTTPDWARDAVWYQIFPDRFRNGDPTNDPGEKFYERLTRWTSDWWQAQPGEAPGDENFFHGKGNVWQRRYGGDIAGIQKELSYLKTLGINAIYLNPIFEAESMHKYDTADYRHVDDNFGVKDDPQTQPVGAPAREPTPFTPIGNRKLYELDGTPLPDTYVETDDPATWKWTKSDLLFLDFLKDAKAQGFHVIIDGVFNHVGRAHPFFQDVMKNGKDSKYADWFDIESFPDSVPTTDALFGKDGGLKFKAWDGPSGHLPAFRKTADGGLAPGPKAHIIAITKRWLAPGDDSSRGVSGIRLDVPNDIPHPFWIEWRKIVKAANPDALIIGEIWSPAQPWINKGDQFDAVMNYQFAMAAQDFFVNQSRAISPSKFANRLNTLVYGYPLQAALVMQNLFDSHDTDRATSMYVNPDRGYDQANRNQDNAKENPYSHNKPTEEQWTRFKQAVAFQYTFLGTPMTYYGNEAGMWSPDDPSNRQPMIWRDLLPFDDAQVQFKDDLFKHFQRLAAIRSALAPLRRGSFYTVKSDDGRGVYVFARELDSQTVYVAINRSSAAQSIELDIAPKDKSITFVDWMSESMATLTAGENLRPSIVIDAAAAGYQSDAGVVTISIPAYGTSILTEKN